MNAFEDCFVVVHTGRTLNYPAHRVVRLRGGNGNQLQVVIIDYVEGVLGEPVPPELLSCGFCNVIVIDTKFCDSESTIVALGAIGVWGVVALAVLLLPALFGPFKSTTGG